MHAARGRVSRTGLVLIAWILLAACGAPRPEGAGSALPVPDSSINAPDTVIEEIRYRLTGGIAGFDLELRLAGGGGLTVIEAGRPARSGQLAVAEWREVVGLATAARMAELKPQYGAPGSVVDALNEVVTVTGGGRTITVAVAGDPRDEPPPSFGELANRLREIALTKAK